MGNMGYGDRLAVWALEQSGSKLPHSKRFAPTNAHCIRWRLDRGAFPSDGVAADTSQPGVADSPRGAGAVILPGRQLSFLLPRAGKYAGR